VVYNQLSRKDESRLFIDINTKQRPVPNELLLDIKKLAEYESDVEQLLGQVFDLFNTDSSSPLLGLMSAAERTSGSISRVTFNTALKKLIPIFGESEAQEIYEALAAYLTAFISGADSIDAHDVITKPQVFRAVMLLFIEVGQRVKDKYGKAYEAQNFSEVLQPMFARVRASVLQEPGTSYKELHENLSRALKTSFTL
jgi:hypothetical protein